jgi:hypothetical protein
MSIKTIFISGFWFACGSLSLQQAAAQLVPSSAFPPEVAHNTSAKASHPRLSPAATPATAAESDETKVVRIYRGIGYFDQAMAEKLRPKLAKAFAPAKSAALQTLPGAAIAAGSVPAAPKPPKSNHL